MIDRAYGCLVGGAIGDAMGMPASFLTRTQMKKTYGYIQDFLEPNAEEQSFHGNLHAGEITDDTMEGMIISDILIQQNGFSKEAFQEAMKTWAIEQKMLESTVIGPSTRRFLTALVEGNDPTEGAKLGNTNGSSMRVAPIGIKYWNDFESCMKAAAESSLPSHGSQPAVGAACAVAMAVAAGVHGGLQPSEVMEKAIEGAKYGESRGFDITAPSVSKRIILAKKIVEQMKNSSMNDILDELVGILGASMFAYESVPLSLGIFYAVNGNAKEGILAAVNAGDDADTNGSICGNICGAYSGAAMLPEEWKNRVQKVGNLDFYKTAQQLLDK